MFNLKILRSDTGSLYEIPVNPSILIGTIKESLTTVTGLAPNEQILLADTNLSSNRTLESYNIIKDREIFLFNKRILENPNLYPEDVNLSLTDLSIPKLPTPKNLKELETSLNPLNKLFTLEFYFNNHVVGTQYLKDVFENKVLQCINSLSELNIQKKSTSAALNSLDEYKNKLLLNYNNFLSLYKKQAPNFESLLNSFETDLGRLKQVKLHESLRYPNRQTLLDCIPENEIRKWSDQCKREFDTLKNKINELGYQVEAIKDNVELELKKSIDINFIDLNERLTLSREHTKQIQALHQSSLSNSEKIKKFLELSRNQKDASQLSNILMSYGEIKYSQDSSFAASIKNAELLSSTLNLYSKSKNHMNLFVYSTLRNISKLQARMHELINSFSIWNEALSKQSSNFFQLECIHHMPSAYEDALNETTRRKKFGNMIGMNLNRFLESLNGIRDEENSKRQTFFERVYQYLPPNIFLSLKEQVPTFQLSLPSFDNQLLSLNINNSGISQLGQSLKSNFNNFTAGGLDVDDDFALIEGTFKKPEIERSISSSSFESKMIESTQQKEKIKSLEMKLQSTFLMASRAEEKYKDLLDKSRVLQSDSMTSDQFRKNQLDEIKNELDEKRQEISRLALESASFQKRIETLQSHEIDLSTKLRDQELENALQLKKMDDLEVEIKSMTNTMLDAEQKSRAELEEYEIKLQDGIREMKEAQEEIDDLKGQIERHEHFIEISNSSTIESQEQSTKLLNEKSMIIGVLEKKVVGLEGEVERGKSAIVSLTDQLGQSERKVRDIEDRNGELSIKISSLTSSSSKQSQDYIDRIQQLVEKSRKLEDEKQALEHAIDDLRYDVENVRGELNSANDELSTFRVLLDTRSSESSEEVERFRDLIQSINSQLDESKTKLAMAEDTRGQLEKSLEVAQDTIRSKDTIISIVQNQMNDLSNDVLQKDEIISSSELQLKDNESTIRDYESQIKKLEEKLLEKDNDHQSLEHSSIQQKTFIDKMQQDNSTMKSSIDSMQKRIAKLTKELDDRDDIVKKLQIDYDYLLQSNRSDKDQLNDQLNNHKQQIQNHTDNILTLTLSNENSLKQINDKQDTIQYLESKVEDLIQQLSILKSQNDNQLNNKIKEMKEKVEQRDMEIENLGEKLNRQTIKITKLEEQYETTNVNYVNSLHQAESVQLSLNEKEELCKSLDEELEKREKDLETKIEENNKITNVIKQISSVVMGYRSDTITASVILKTINDQKDNYLSLEKSMEDQTKLIRTLNDKIKSLESLSVDILMNNQNDETALLSNFRHSRIAIFSHIKNNVYEAVNINSPNYYLSPDCIESFEEEISKKSIIIGTIIEINKLKAEPGNVYGLPTNTEYHELLVGRAY